MSAVAALGGMGINQLVKALVNRPRPPFDLVHVDRHIHSASFPAGHVLNFTAIAGLLCCIAWTRMRPSWRRTALFASLSAAMVLMGVARVASGEHWPSDVLGGYLMGGAWLGVTWGLYRWGRERLASVGLSRPHRPAAFRLQERDGAHGRRLPERASSAAAVGSQRFEQSAQDSMVTPNVDSLTRW